MASPELGTKRICPTTGRKFYDLNKNPVISPYSGEVVPTSVATTLSRGAAPVVARKEAPPEDEDETDGPELVSLDEVEAEDADKDTDTDTEGDDTLDVEEDGDTVEDDTLVVDEDDDDTTDLVEVSDDDDE
ncbi:TIGR02300 family protein [Methylobacterium sp. J-070]|uniref:TIGR02300 family protein n=1 Tax=Methylobacterium sp. J-070 TaxID=2836650 RepID=UPI001FBACFF3|nr:TIGR02300 family protein [Methylobacterium sp. J-070]MCJ2049216.1 TIGR02300 family protein [Methylobacterium sp. J-070]